VRRKDVGNLTEQIAEPIHAAQIHAEMPNTIGSGNAKMRSSQKGMNYSGRFKDQTTYGWKWKWTGTRNGKDVVKFSFRIRDEQPVEKEILYEGVTQQVFDHPELKVEIRPLPP
jgi:hypothetical protein